MNNNVPITIDNKKKNRDSWIMISWTMLVLSLIFLIPYLIQFLPVSLPDSSLGIFAIFFWVSIIYFFCFPFILVVFVIAEIIHIIVCAIKRKKINFFNILRLALTGVSYYIFVKLFTSSF